MRHGAVTTKAEGRRAAERDTDPPSAAAEVIAGAQGTERGPRRALYAGRGARANERPVLRSFGAQAPAPVGLDSTGRSEAEEEAEDMTAARGWRDLCRLDHW